MTSFITVPITKLSEVAFERDMQNVGIYTLVKLIQRIVGRGDADEMMQRLNIGNHTGLFRMARKLGCATRLLFPLHVYMVDNDCANRESFLSLLSLLNEAYPQCYESPGDTLSVLRDSAEYMYISIYNVALNSVEVETMMNSGAEEWDIYSIIVEMNLLSTIFPHDVKRHSKAGVYDESTGNRLIPATMPCAKKHDSHINTKPIYDLYELLKDRDETNFSEYDIVSLREALRCTVPMKDGVVVDRDSEHNLMLRVAPNAAGASHNVVKECSYCNEDMCEIYAPNCKHLISCRRCMDGTRAMVQQYCHVCNSSWKFNKVFFAVENIVGVMLDKGVDSAALCEAMAPGVVFCDAVHRNINSDRHNTVNVMNVASYISRVADIPPFLVYERATQYLSEHHSMRHMEETLWYIGAPRRLSQTIQIGYAFSGSIGEFVKRNPDHTVEQVLSLQAVPKVYRNSDECISCLEECELLVMSKCGHQVSCKDCSIITGSRCPLCRSDGNVALHLLSNEDSTTTAMQQD